MNFAVSLLGSLLGFFMKNLSIIIFYSVIVVLILLFKNRFTVESKFILLYKTKLGISLMNFLSKKYRSFFRVLGYSGIGFGFVGMLFILFFLIKSSFSIFFKPSVEQSVSLVLPGTSIPGVGTLNFPFWIITIFIIAFVHEFGHGVIARTHNIKVKSSGIVFFGPIIGAFVEPDEKQLEKSSDVVQYSVFAAGPFFNLLLTFIVVLLLNTALMPMFYSVSQPVGVSFSSITPGFPAANAGLEPGIIISRVNNVSIKNSDDFSNFMFCTRPNQTLVFESFDNKTFTLITKENPDFPSKGYIGVVGIKDEFKPKQGFRAIFNVLSYLIQLFRFLGILSLGIGLFNLLPLGVVDGGRMLRTFLLSSFKKKKALLLWKRISLCTLIVLLINLVGPFLKRLLLG